MRSNWRYLLGLSLMVALVLAGCQIQPVETYFRGQKAVNDSIAELKPGTSDVGQWQTFDLRIDYKTLIDGDSLQISGTATLGPYYQMNIRLVRSLDVYLFFLDDDSRVIKTVELSEGIFSYPDEVIVFDRRLDVPAAATSIAFGYRGRAYRDGGGDDSQHEVGGGGLDYFDDLPLRKG